MKFCKRYREYMQERGKHLPGVGLKRLKRLLKVCRSESIPFQNGLLRRRRELVLQNEDRHGKGRDKAERSRRAPVLANGCFNHYCQVCDGIFFPTLLSEMSAVIGCFNERAQKLLEMHLTSGFWKCCMWFKGKLQFGRRDTLMQEGNDLVTYAIINSIAMRKILKKYDKIHYSKQGQAFRSQAQSMHIDILQSPWLRELMAFYINLRGNNFDKKTVPGLVEDCFLTFDGGKPILSCGLFDSLKFEVNLTCSICLDTVFDPVSLTCGHIFCYMCCCSAASVTIVDGLKSADPKARCPLCRESGVYGGAVHLDELSVLLSESCPEYWEQRFQSERVERIQQVKEYWDSHCRALMGI